MMSNTTPTTASPVELRHYLSSRGRICNRSSEIEVVAAIAFFLLRRKEPLVSRLNHTTLEFFGDPERSSRFFEVLSTYFWFITELSQGVSNSGFQVVPFETFLCFLAGSLRPPSGHWYTKKETLPQLQQSLPLSCCHPLPSTGIAATKGAAFCSLKEPPPTLQQTSHCKEGVGPDVSVKLSNSECLRVTSWMQSIQGNTFLHDVFDFKPKQSKKQVLSTKEKRMYLSPNLVLNKARTQELNKQRAPVVSSFSARHRRLSGASHRLIGVSCRRPIVRSASSAVRPPARRPIVSSHRLIVVSPIVRSSAVHRPLSPTLSIA
ncbi:hypothetical protein EJ110_NYTH44777 [Nymphaea thermarum]|nr:hypothetical protein EJ110_NYTH44777 [Nymphaea thermarum]